jgi:hypothetical protein
LIKELKNTRRLLMSSHPMNKIKKILYHHKK